MTIRPWLAALGLLIVSAAARAADPPTPVPAMAPGCKFNVNSAGRVREGDNIPVSVRLRNTAQWCITGFSFGGNANGAHIVDQPGHGELRVIHRPDGIIIAYRPKPGFVGGDTFLIGLPGEYGMETHYSATVTVEP